MWSTIIGVGNCASPLIQGVQFYRDAKDNDFGPGLMHVDWGVCKIRAIEFTFAFAGVGVKVGLDLSKAVFAAPNNTQKCSDVPRPNVKVKRGIPTMDWVNTCCKL